MLRFKGRISIGTLPASMDDQTRETDSNHGYFFVLSARNQGSHGFIQGISMKFCGQMKRMGKYKEHFSNGGLPRGDHNIKPP
ncbi:hypothetical protein ACS0TY_029512 [Phlomoides rotata]